MNKTAVISSFGLLVRGRSLPGTGNGSVVGTTLDMQGSQGNRLELHVTIWTSGLMNIFCSQIVLVKCKE